MPDALPPATESVSQLARRVRRSLEGAFERVVVRGEISNFRAYGSGHWYFTLKDEQAQLKAAMFGRDNRFVRFRPKDGDEVLVQGRVDLYDRRGDLQIVASWMEPLGAGRLQQRFEQLKARLQAEGLFDAARKRRLPRVVRRVGIVTSEKAAALHDMLRTLLNRDPTLAVTIAPCRVQGDGAAGSIAAAIELLNRASDVEVILCGRGGGSLEDLWAFNEETVARAIAASTIPVVSAVGHEIDFTIADLVADARAATPTAAAELVVRPRADLEATIEDLRGRLAAAQGRVLGRRRARVKELEARLISPRRRLQLAWQRLDDARDRLGHSALAGQSRRRNRLDAASRALGLLGPLASLSRGYAIVVGDETGPVLRDAAAVPVGSEVRVRLNRGALRCTVDSVVHGADLDLRGRRRE